MVLLLSFTVVGAGLTLVTVQAAERRIQHNIASSQQASLLAQAAEEWAFRQVETLSDWRSAFTSGQVESVAPGTGLAFDLIVTDADGNLEDDDTDLVTVTATGKSRGAVVTTSLSATPYPHRALGYAVVAGHDLGFGDSTVAGPVYAGNVMWTWGTVTTRDNASFETPLGGVIGAGLNPSNAAADTLALPTPDLDFYAAKATTVSLDDGDLQRDNLTTTANSQGSPNAQGLYYVHIGWNNVKVRDVHVNGTLIIEGYGSNTVAFDSPNWLEAGPDGHPTLLIDVPNGAVHFRLPASQLEEGGSDVDFNEDGDRLDSFSSSIQGLVWVNAARVDLYESMWTMTGTLIATNDVFVYHGVTVDDDPAVTDQLTPGFTDGMLHVIRGSIREGGP